MKVNMRVLKTGLQMALLAMLTLWSAGQNASAAVPDVLWSLQNTVPKQIIFSPDSQTAVMESGCDLSVRGCQSDAYIWNVKEGKQLFTLPAAGIPTHFTPDGQAVYTDDQGQTIRTVKAWRIADGQYLGDVVADAGPSGDVSHPNLVDGFSSDDRFYVVRRDHYAQVGPRLSTESISYDVYQTDGSKGLTTLQGNGYNGVFYNSGTWAFSPSGNIVTSSHNGRTLPTDILEFCDFISLSNGTASLLFTAPGDFVAMTPDDRFALVNDSGSRIKEGQLGQLIQGPHVISLWDVSKGQLVQSWPISLPSDATKLTFTPFARFTANGQVVLTPPASGSPNGPIQVIGEKIGSATPVYSVTHSNPPLFTTDNRYFGTFEDGIFTVRDADTGEIVRTDGGRITAALPTQTLTPTQLSPDGKRVVTDNSLFWNLDDGTLSLAFRSVKEPLAFSADSQQLAVRTRDANTVDSFRAGDGSYLRTYAVKADSPVFSIGSEGAFSPDGKTFVYSPNNSDVFWWDAPSGVMTYISNLGLYSPDIIYAFSPDSRILAAVTQNFIYDASQLKKYEQFVWLWDAGDHHLIDKLDTSMEDLRSLAFSPDGQFLAAGSADGLTRVWRMSDRTLLYTLAGAHSTVSSLMFLSDHETLAIGQSDQTLRLWRLTDDHPYRILEGDQLLPDGSGYLSRLGNDLLFHRLTDERIYETYEGLGNARIIFSPDSRSMAYTTNDVLQVARVPVPPADLSGDLNGDQSVDIRDAQLGLLMAVGSLQPSEAQAQSGDLDADGKITVSDVVLILQLATGLRSTVPAPTQAVPLSDSMTDAMPLPFWKQKQPLPQDTSSWPAFNVFHNKDLHGSQLLSADNDVWGGVWEPAFLYQDHLTGNFSMSLLVGPRYGQGPYLYQGCDALTAVGLMVAQSVPDRYSSVSEIPTWGLVQATAGYGVEAKWGGQGQNQSTLSATTSLNTSNNYSPWVRLDRQGNRLTYYSSFDGKTWKQEGQSDFTQMAGVAPLSGPIAAGIELQAHCADKPMSAIASEFHVDPLP